MYCITIMCIIRGERREYNHTYIRTDDDGVTTFGFVNGFLTSENNYKALRVKLIGRDKKY